MPHRFGVEPLVRLARAREVARELVAIPGERAARREHDAHQVPHAGDDVAERVRAERGIDARLCRRREHRARRPPARHRFARRDRRRRRPRRTRCPRRRRRPACPARSPVCAARRPPSRGRAPPTSRRRRARASAAARPRRGSRCSSAGAPCRTSASPTRRTARSRASPVSSIANEVLRQQHRREARERLRLVVAQPEHLRQRESLERRIATRGRAGAPRRRRAR